MHLPSMPIDSLPAMVVRFVEGRARRYPVAGTRRLALRGVGAVALLLGCGLAHGSSAGTCTAVPVPTDSQDVTCVVDPAARDRPLHFVAVFGGSHDDTKISLAAVRDGQAIDCDAGSKTSLFAEDGVVQLDCRVGRATSGPSPTTLKFALTVHHAQFVAASLDAD